MDPTVRLNDAVYSWNSVIHRVGTLRTVGLTSMSMADEIEQALVWCARRDGLPIGMTAGKYKPSTVTAKYLMEAWTGGTTRFPLGVESVFHDGLGSSGRTLAPVFVQLFEEATGQPVSLVMSRCRLIKRNITTEDGVEGAVLEATLQPMAMFINGISLFSVTRGLP